jgi:hypothetical protein
MNDPDRTAPENVGAWNRQGELSISQTDLTDKLK